MNVSDHNLILSADPGPRPVRRLASLPGPKGVPLLGNMFQIKSTRFHQILEDWEAEFGPFYRVQIGRKSMMVVADNTTIANLLRSRPGMFRRGSRVSNALNELGSRGVFTAEGEEWRKQRKLVMRALTPEVVRNFFPTMIAMTEALLRRWQTAVSENRPINLLRDLKAFSLDVTVALAMGQNINTLENDDNPLQRDIEQLFACVARRITAPFPYWRYVRLPVDRAADACADRIRKTTADLILQTRERLGETPALRQRPTNMLEALIVARDEPNSGFTDENVIGNAITMVFAGEDTTANAIAWLLDCVARQPEVASCLQSEADDVLGGHPILRDFGALDRFVYLDATAAEAMRVKPAASVLSMKANMDLTVADIFVPKGTLIMTLLRRGGQQGSDDLDNRQFCPQRCTPGQGSAAAKDVERKQFPFGGGARFCLGRYLAMTEIKMVMSMLARNFTLGVDPAAPPVQEFYKFTMTPSALPVRLTARRS